MERFAMNDIYEKITLSQDTTLQDAALHLEKNDLDDRSRVVLYVVDSTNKLLGSIMDVDIRRAIIQNNLSPQTKVLEIMNKSPRKIVEGGEADIQTYKNWKRFQYIPIVDNEGMLLGYKENHEIYNYSNKVIIMAGGLGTRLRPLTYDTPKPMLKLAGKPILQEIIESFKLKGFNNFLISVNYKAEVIKNYFHEGRDFGVKIHYLEEEERLGTCGSIKLAQTFINEPFFVINGDILASIDYEQLLIRHKEEKNDITICTFPYHYTVPYGVIEINHSTINIIEKPTYTHQINCGIYLINPSLLTLIQEHTYLDMPNLIQEAILKQFKVGTFMIDDWIDIGNLEDFYKARNRINHSKE